MILKEGTAEEDENTVAARRSRKVLLGWEGLEYWGVFLTMPFLLGNALPYRHGMNFLGNTKSSKI